MLTLADKMTACNGRRAVHVVPFTHIQEELSRACPEELLHRHHAPGDDDDRRKGGTAHGAARALITGESLAQVASQTMQAIGCTDAACQAAGAARPSSAWTRRR